MNSLPGPAQLFQVIHQDSPHAPDLPPRESIIFPEICRPCRTVQIEYCLVAFTNHVNMRWSMVVWINHNPQSVKPENRRHYSNSNKIPKRLGLSSSIGSRISRAPAGVAVPTMNHFGKLTVKVLPRPNSLAHSTVPRCDSAIQRTMARPSPKPPSWRLRASPAR